MTNIFFDLDGTLIDSRPRMYRLFQEMVPQSTFTFDNYWALKRARVNQEELLRTHFNYDADQVRQFKQDWRTEIEQPDRLDEDTPHGDIQKLLTYLSGSFDLYVVTARQNPSLAVRQIEKLGWGAYFKDILVTQQRSDKAENIALHVSTSRSDIIVGDTGEDILAGKKLGVHTIAVLSGILDRQRLQEYAPDAILNSVVELNEYMPI